MSLVSELERLADALADTADGTPSPLVWSSVAGRIAKNLGVKADEVGILGLSTKWRHLYFLAPEALKNVGTILGIVVVLIVLPGILVSAWSGMSLLQQIALGVIGITVWQWLRPRRHSASKKQE